MIDDQTLRAVEHLVHAIRADRNLPAWDRLGVTSTLASLKHLDVDELVRRVGHTAGHPDTKSPGRLRQAFLADPPPSSSTPQPPHRDEACGICAHHAARCVCSDDRGRRTGATPQPPRHKPQGKPMDPALRASLKNTLRAIREQTATKEDR